MSHGPCNFELLTIQNDVTSRIRNILIRYVVGVLGWTYAVSKFNFVLSALSAILRMDWGRCSYGMFLRLDCTLCLDLPYFFGYKTEVFPFKTIPKI